MPGHCWSVVFLQQKDSILKKKKHINNVCLLLTSDFEVSTNWQLFLYDENKFEFSF
jgi:hypothetical protein